MSEPDWKEVLLARLAEHGNVSRACKEAGCGRSTAYELRERDPDFDRRWLDAIDAFADDLESEAVRRGRDGTTTPKWHRTGTDEHGKPVFERHDIRTYSDALLLARLKAIRPELYRESYDTDKWVRAAMEVVERSKAWEPKEGGK